MILSFGASGFNCLRWAGEFYPEDLPAEWCCDYYANEFDSVYLNHEKLDEFNSAIASLDSNFYLLVEDDQKFHRLFKVLEKKGLPRIGYCTCNNSAPLHVGQFLLHTGKVSSTDGLLDESQYVLAYHEAAISDSELKKLVEYLFRQFKTSSHVFVFFEGDAVSTSQIKRAQTICDLMDGCTA